MKIIAQLTDLHTDDFLSKKYRIDTRKNVEAALNAVSRRGVRDLILTGDIGESASLPWLLDAIAGRGMTPSFILGNHDKAETFRNLEGVKSLFRQDGLYYARVIEGILCLFLDSSAAVIGREQFAWLREQARTASLRRLVLFVHHPILDCGNTLMDRRFPLKNREAVRDFLDGLDLEVFVFCGHYHTNHEQRRGRISQYLTPSIFVQFKQDAETFQVESTKTAYRIIELDAGTLRTELVPID